MRCYLFESPKDWRTYFAECNLDTPIEHIIELARAMWCYGLEIVYVSGRSDECREATEAWLEKCDLPTGPVYMRTAGDHRNDDVLKIELLAQIRADGYEVVMAVDDRSRVVKAWRAAGVPCAQIADGDF